MSPSHAQKSRQASDGGQTASTTKVHICGRPLLRRGLEQVFEGTNFIVSEPVLGPYQPSNGASSPELFIIDGESCPADVVGIISDLKALHAGSRLILLADHLDAGGAFAACHAGADGICLTSSSPDVLIRSMQLVMLGEVVVSSGLILSAISNTASAPVSQPEPAIKRYYCAAPKNLSNREVEVLHWLQEGAPNKVIARKLNVAEATIKVHVKAILKKINVSNRAQAAIWAAHNMTLNQAGL